MRFQNVSQSSSRLNLSKYPSKLSRKKPSTDLSFGYAWFGILISARGEVSMKRFMMLAPIVWEKFAISFSTAPPQDPSISSLSVVAFPMFSDSSS